MKIWKEYGSSHSADVTIVGEFETESDAEKAYPILEDFINASWEERYENVKEFIDAWTEKGSPGIGFYGPTQDEFDMGVDNSPDIIREKKNIIIKDLRSTKIGGIINIFFYNGMKKITIEGHPL